MAQSPTAVLFNEDLSADTLYRQAICLSAQLAHMRGIFGGDLDAFLIYLLFAADTLHHNRPGRAEIAGTIGMNALSVSDITGIPRETTRRKLQFLQALHIVERAEDGLYRLNPDHNIEMILRGLAKQPRREAKILSRA